MPNPWIEFFGPPGVGKSTICRETEFLTGLPNKSAAGRGSIEHLVGRSPEWREFVAHVSDAYTRARPGARESRQQTFHRMLKRADYCLGAGGLWLLDDFLSQRGQSLMAAGGRQQDVSRFFELVPPPLGLVVLRHDPETIKSRNFRRSISRPRKPDLSREVDAALGVVDLATPILRDRGVSMLELTSDRSPLDTAQDCRDFIGKLRARHHLASA